MRVYGILLSLFNFSTASTITGFSAGAPKAAGFAGLSLVKKHIKEE
jgi:hypothetical protein